MYAALNMTRLYAIAFIASGCTLVIELVAGRLLAPYIGVSLYTWTSVIGVILAGISIGNFLGGRLADRYPGPSVLGLTLVAASLTSFVTLGLVSVLPQFTLWMPLVPRILVLTTVIFFLPGCILGMITPLVVKQALTDLGHAGSLVGVYLGHAGGLVGRVYAISTAGSLVGVYLTGFVLIAHFGTRLIVVMVAAVLLLLGAVLGNLLHGRSIRGSQLSMATEQRTAP